MKKKEKVRLLLDFFWGPILMSDPNTGEPQTGIDIIDNDLTIKELCREMSDMYFSYFEENSHGVAMWFDEEKRKNEKPKMMELLAKLKTRLDEINDGSFCVQDDITDQYKDV